MSAAPAVSIVIPVFDRLDLTRQCLRALEESTALPVEAIVVDNGSTDGTGEFLRAEEAAGRLRAVVNGENLGFGRACNQGLSLARGRHVVFLNNDTVPLPGWLEALVDAVEGDPSVGLVGSRLLYADDTIQHAGILWNDDDELYHVHRHAPREAPEVLESRDFPAVTGACILLPAPLLRRLGGFDESFHMYVEDVDLCMRVWESGHRVRYCAESVLYHLENASVPSTLWRNAHVVAGWQRLQARWAGRWPVEVRRLSWPATPPGGPRHFAVLAYAEELLADPELLAAYGRALAGCAEATLVIVTPEAAQGEALAAAVEDAGLDGADAPDLLAVPEAPAAAHLLAVYSAWQQPPALAHLPRFDAATAAELAAGVARAYALRAAA